MRAILFLAMVCLVMAVILETANSKAVKKDNKKGAVSAPAKGKAALKGAAKGGIKKDAKSKGKGKKEAKSKKDKKAKPAKGKGAPKKDKKSPAAKANDKKSQTKSIAAVKLPKAAAENAQKGPSSAEVLAEENNLDTEAVDDDFGVEASDINELSEDALLEDDAMDSKADTFLDMGEEAEMDSQMAN
ncbi:hypothetical protein niasHT_017142 [Heterodera trifolii]|uniref:Effector protein n=1 Tax=Heterodera trifolii TaxID=157864 RepID=A0ABD2L720_9BILA